MDHAPDLLAAAGDRLSRVERAQIAFIKRSFEPGALDQAIRFCQRRVGAVWIDHATRRLRRVHGLERLPHFPPEQSFICVSNHRSFFDLYVITAELVRRGLPQRIAFPVRSTFFYDSPLGFVVNGAMSFFAMYPPIFREKKKLTLNPTSLEELAWLLRRGGTFAGVHPEGTRKQDDDPYSFLPAQRGVGRLIFDARVPVVPVFVNGLENDIVRQVRGNYDGTGTVIHIVFGAPIDFGGLLEQRRSPKTDRAIAERTLEVIGRLGAEERELRARG
ncbi:MAG: lysophospholipid acyltransferase family protein [Sorangiineae bacterium]|nr:lysophospholipid acyltransferase family protein [Polyangiaceae bacterium]MEB2322265.1 lysophospholipid acyltransferase family protein [Sorangiineae bacterium]